jgi:2',3'-cyclic-nucleotide 2'-phosphodiesterase (5'-nucleotidase family)
VKLGVGLVFAAAAAIPLALVAFAPPSLPEGGRVHVVILHTNDIHGQALPLRQKDGSFRGGFAALARAIERERESARSVGCEPLLVDAGDIWVGPPEGTRTEGRFVVSFMNDLHYDVGAIGNHELDHGPAHAAALTRSMTFPILGANVKRLGTRQVPRWLHSSVVIERSGIPIRFIGLLTSKLAEVTTPNAMEGLEVEDEAKALGEALAERRPGEVTIAVSHCGHEVDKDLALKFHGVLAAIVGGHTHRSLEWHVPEDKRDAVLIAQTGSRTENLGRIDLDIDRTTHEVVRAEGRLIPLTTGDEDPKWKALVAAEAAECNKLLGVKVGSVGKALTRNRGHASNLGSVVCDALREATGADLAFTNPQGLRADIPAGDVLLRSLYEVDPFENTLVKMHFRGDELRLLLEEMCTVAPLESSGLELRYDSRLASGKRVLEVKIGGAALDDAKDYTIVTNNFLAAGGDKYTRFRKGERRADTGLPCRELVRAYFEKHSPLPDPDFAHRVVNAASE